MAAPFKRGLDYYQKMVNFYDDDKIIDLLDSHGPLGVVVYDVILGIIYSNGYYINLSVESLARKVARVIGSKWVRNTNAVVQVIRRLADLGLLDKDLMLRGIMTSEGIQKRYYQVAVILMKRQLYSTEYWILRDDNGSLLLSAPKKRINSEETPVNSEETKVNSEETPIKRKENKRNIYSAPRKNAFNAFPQRDYDMGELEQKLLGRKDSKNGDRQNGES